MSSSSQGSGSGSSSSRNEPILGSAYLTSQSLIPPASPHDPSPSLCLNLSLFKTTLKKYRALDDSITTRLNRDAALHRADSFNSGSPSYPVGDAASLPVLDVQEEGQRRTCLRIWRDMTESWKRRERIIRYCASTVDDRLKDREAELSDVIDKEEQQQERRRDFDRLDAGRSANNVRDDLFSEQVKRQQLHNELSVESIIRRRTLAAFFSRCPAFQPPPDPDGGPAVPTVDLAPMPMRSRPINN